MPLDSGWLTKLEARRRLGIGREALERLIEARQLGIRKVPGSFARVLEEDVDRLAESATTRAAGTSA